MTTTTMALDAMMDRAREIAADGCTLDWHDNLRGHTAIRITGCRPEDAARIGRAIEGALLGSRDPETGLLPVAKANLGFTQNSGWAAVWVR